jgi:hypothetical protein
VKKISTRPAAIALCAAAGLATSGCHTSGHTAVEPAPTVPAPAAPEVKPEPAWAQTAPLDLERIIQRAEPVEAAPIQAAPVAQPPAPAPPSAPAAPAESLPSMFEMGQHSPGMLAPIFATNIPAEAATKALPARVEDSAIALMGLLAQQIADPQTAWRACLAMAALDLVHPGSMPQVISPDLKGAAALTPEDIATADAVRQFLSELAALPPDTTPQARAAKLAQWAEQAAAAAPMRVTAAALCERVMGFGQYTPLNSGRFLQGRAQRAIVYIEVANFGHRPIEQTQTGDRWIVNLSQALQLYHDADGTLAWSRPEEEIIETSRNKRRDFYLVNDITFPPTLTIGAYRLKVIMRDKVSGQVEERVIPFEVVADAALAAGSASR